MDRWRCYCPECGFEDNSKYCLHTVTDCLTRQLETARAALAQRDERIKELEAYRENIRSIEGEIESYIKEPVRSLAGLTVRFRELTDDLAALRPIVRAAMEWELAERRYTHRKTPEPGVGDFAALVSAKHVLEAEVRALPPEVRARIEDRGGGAWVMDPVTTATAAEVVWLCSCCS